MVDFSKIRVGDEVTIRAKIKECDNDGTFKIQTCGIGGWCAPYEIVTHVPAPRKIEVGDEVTWGGKADNFRVLAISGRRAWLVNVRNSHDERLHPLSALQHAD